MYCILIHWNSIGMFLFYKYEILPNLNKANNFDEQLLLLK